MNKKVYKIMSAIVLFALIFGSYSNAGASSVSAPQMAVTTYFVSASGNDSNAGTSSAPFKTVTKAINTSANGNKIIVSAGSYSAFAFADRTVECIPARSCVVKSTITLNGNATLKGFVVDGFSQQGGIELYVGNNLAENNEVRNGVQCPAGATCPSYADADGFRFHGNGNIMRSNYIHDISYTNPLNQSATKPPHIDCFQTWADSYYRNTAAVNTIIEYNICDNHSALASYGQGTAGVELDNAVGTIIRNNYFKTYSKKIGLDVANSNTTINNNIFEGGPRESFGQQMGVFVTSGTNTIVKNNIFWKIRPDGYASSDWIYGVPAANQIGNLIKVDPLLNSTYHPSVGSPACLSTGEFIGIFPCDSATLPTATWTAILPTFTSTNTSTPTLSFTSTATQTSITPTLVVTSTAPIVSPVASSIPPSPTSIASVVAASPTPTASPTAMPVQPSVTPTASSLPALPTSTSVQPSATPIAATPTASAVPVLPTSTSVQPIATVQQQSQPASETKYDDKHSSFVYSSDWRNVSLAQASGGSFKKTGEDGSSVTFTFTGQSFSVIYTSGPAYGQVKVYIDGQLVKTIDENEKTTGYQKRWDYPGQLTLGKHTLKLVTVGNGGAKSSIDAVIVR